MIKNQQEKKHIRTKSMPNKEKLRNKLSKYIRVNQYTRSQDT